MAARDLALEDLGVDDLRAVRGEGDIALEGDGWTLAPRFGEGDGDARGRRVTLPLRDRLVFGALGIM